MPLLIRTHYNLARAALKQNRTRSFLTCLGIAIGVAAIVLILSLMGSIQNLISQQVKNIGTDLILVRPSTHKDTVDSIVSELTSSNQYQKSNLSLTDIESLKTIKNISAIAPISISTNTIKADKTTVDSASIVATNPDLIKIQNFKMKSGSFLSKEYGENTAVVGSDIALYLFNNLEPVGRTITISGKKFLIVGELDKNEDPINFNNVDFDNSIFVKADYFNTLDSNIQIQQISTKVANTGIIEDTKSEIRSILTTKKSGDNNFTVLSNEEITHPAGSLFTIISGMLTLVAGISLIVGGIGVMNIMLVSVAERTHEIGIRKAVGASALHILSQFLFESLILSCLGGIFGLCLGYIFAFLISIITPFSPYISLEILGVTLATSLFIGTLFGMYPAIKAAVKNPIDSLRRFR